ncbi:MAG: hypothetical protein ACXAD7_26080 [Candidatus Kariarchaeaceae archaeon]|jgi:hypothetical protein
MKATWRVINQESKYRLQHTEIPDEEIKSCRDVDQAYDFIEEIVESEFRNTVHWDFHDNELLLEDIGKVFNNV